MTGGIKRGALLIILLSGWISLGACSSNTESVQTGNTSENEPVQTGEISETEPVQNESSPKGPISDETNKELSLSITDHRIESELRMQRDGEEFPYAYMVYPEIAWSKEAENRYPRLAESLKADNEAFRKFAMNNLADAVSLAKEGEEWLNTSNQLTETIEIYRADDKMFGYRITWNGYYNGAHPDTWYESVAYDAESGEGIPLTDVINGEEQMKKLPQIILENLDPIAVEDYQFTDEENAEMLSKIEDMVAEGDIVWTLDEKGLHVFFDAYDLQFYAFGPIFCDISLTDHPELIVEQYRPNEVQSIVTERVRYEQADTEVYSESELSSYKRGDMQ